jgi:hypothetical protein
LKKEKNTPVSQTLSTPQYILPCETIDLMQSTSSSVHPHNLSEPMQSNTPLAHARKPTETYYEIIRAAIESVPEKRITLKGIYNYAVEHYDFFTNTGNSFINNKVPIGKIHFAIIYQPTITL